jgi:3,4-dihydroxy 2-butanone 4-phosphate synthase/GTP cyclohydrolase II
VRFAHGRDPQPIVVDSRLRIPRETRLLENGRKAWIAATEAAPSSSEAELQSRGATVLRVRALENGWVDLPLLLGMLADRGVRHLLVEGGARILTSFLERKIVDYVVVTISPRFVGGVRTLEPRPRSSFPSLGSWRSERIGKDLVLAGELSPSIEHRE